MNLYTALPKKEIPQATARQKAIIEFDPSPIYSRIKIDPFKRHQSFKMEDMWPSISGKCACGCGKNLPGRRRKWATDECSRFASSVYFIISGQTQIIYNYLVAYWGRECAGCKRSYHLITEQDRHDRDSHLAWIDPLEVDHIVEVRHGGGGSWLGNFQLLCHKCHVNKTTANRN